MSHFKNTFSCRQVFKFCNFSLFRHVAVFFFFFLFDLKILLIFPLISSVTRLSLQVVLIPTCMYFVYPVHALSLSGYMGLRMSTASN